MSAIVDIVGREILDSRGNPTVECDVLLESGTMGRAAVPSGASTGSREAIELRDGDKARYLGKGVLRAVEHINTEISESVLGLDASEQAFLDKTLIDLDGTDNKSRLGANATLAVSMAVARAAAEESGLPLYRYFGGMGGMQMPVPMMNVINGGAHANNNLDLQELMIIPVGAPTFREAVRYGAEVFHALKKIIDDQGHEHRGRRRRRLRAQRGQPRGGDPADPGSHRQGRLHRRRADRARPGLRGQRVLQGRQVPPRRAKACSCRRAEWTDMLATWVRQVPDHQHRRRHGRNDWDGWKHLTDRWARRCSWWATTCSSPTRKILKEGIEKGIANSILIKINQIGTLTETFAAIEMAKRAGWTTSSATARARPRTPPSPTSRWAPTPARSRPAR
jgi:enolase